MGVVCFYLRNALVLLPSFCRPFAVFDSKGIGEAFTAYRFSVNLNLGGVAIEKSSKICIIQKKAVSLPRFCRI